MLRRSGIYLLAVVWAMLNSLPVLRAQQNPIANNATIPKPPDVASLLKFSEVPISYFNGTAKVGIPLYEIKSGDLSYPIEINYHTAGIRVDEEAGIVGLGWSLSTVASVTEMNPSSLLNPQPHPSIVPDGFDQSPSQVPANAFNLPVTGEAFKDFNGNCNTYPAFSPVYPNFEPDPMVMNANGISAKFFIPNGQTNWVCADGQNIQFSTIFTGGIGGFGWCKAILPDGTMYMFDQLANAQTPVDLTSPASLPNIAHTYYLSQITSATGRMIRFTYLDKTAVPQTISQQPFSEIWTENAPPDGPTTGATIEPSTLIDNVYLDSIYFDNGYCKYHYSTRLDMDGYKLDSICIFQAGNPAPVRSIHFQYGYYAFDGSTGDYITGGQLVGLSEMNGPPLSYRQNRLKLTTVQTNLDPPYTLGYNSMPLPYKTSFAQDLWGYYNGNFIPTLIPDYNQLGYFDSQIPISLLLNAHHFPFANRAANANTIQAGILNRITYPTGGYTAYQYEPNTWHSSDYMIVDTNVAATDIGSGLQQVVFTVPNVNITGTGINTGVNVNPAYVNVDLICAQGGTGACSITNGYAGGCSGYSGQNTANGLYALLEYFDPVANAWVAYQSNIFDFTNADLNASPCFVNNIYRELIPGQYRITANYPDNLPTGAYGGPFAAIGVTYKVIRYDYNHIGGGLRVSSITDFSAGGQVAKQRKITYSAGQLMTQPIFYRYCPGSSVSGGTPPGGHSSCVPQGQNLWQLVITGQCANSNGNDIPEFPYYIYLYNNPILPYSFSANGSPIGYDTVYEQTLDGQGNDQGRTMYRYTVRPDAYNFYGTNMPGTPSTPFLDNGALIEKQEQKKLDATTYTPVHDVSCDYAVGSAQTFWAFKFEYFQRWYTTRVPEYNCLDPDRQYFHLYPIKTGHLNMTDKTESFYAPGRPPFSVHTNYTYNALNQQSTETTTESNGKTQTKQTWYPGDYTSTGDFLNTMRSLNMLDYPIEKVTLVNNLAVAADFTQFLSHDGIMTPYQLLTLKTAQPVTLTSSAPGNTPDSHYEPRVNYTYDSHGKLIQQQPVNGMTTNYLWDYNNSLPVAELINGSGNDFAYSSFEADGKGNWSYSGSPVADATTPGGSFRYDLSSGAITGPALTSSKTYVVSYWTKNASPFSLTGSVTGYPVTVRQYNGWTNYMHKITGVSSITISGTGSIDDLRLYPDDAQMTTYIYNPLIGISSSSDHNCKMTYYDYDPDQRLKDIRDPDGNIIKEFQYNYAGFPAGNGFPIATYSNLAMSGTYYSQLCGQGQTPNGVSYSVPAGKYSSSVSFQDAQGQAQYDLQVNGQANANQNGSCTAVPCVTPQITSVVVSGTSYTLTCTGAGSATTVLLNIQDPTTGQNIGGSISAPAAGGTVTGTVPTAGKIYVFTLVAFGANCGTGQTSSPFPAQF